MVVPSTLSENFSDSIVDTVFNLFPEMDEGELICLLDRVFKLADREVRRAVAVERANVLRRLREPILS